jgi:hypothetical protein
MLVAGAPVTAPPAGVVETSATDPAGAADSAVVAGSIWAQIAHIQARTGVDVVILLSSTSPDGLVITPYGSAGTWGTP